MVSRVLGHIAEAYEMCQVGKESQEERINMGWKGLTTVK